MKMENFPAIELLNIGKSYGRKNALEDVSLTLSARQCLALVGHNGAGKTTLIKIILGLLKPDAGTLNVLHADPGSRQFNQLRRNIGFLPEQVLLRLQTCVQSTQTSAKLEALTVNNGILERYPGAIY